MQCLEFADKSLINFDVLKWWLLYIKEKLKQFCFCGFITKNKKYSVWAGNYFIGATVGLQPPSLRAAYSGYAPVFK